MTLEQYGKYQDIIPLADDWWCLATPWRTPNPGGLRSPYTSNTNSVWDVYSDGDYVDVDAAYTGGIRPALYFASDLLVSIEDEGEEDATDGETALYQEYREYIKEWSGLETVMGESPLTFEDWKNDRED